MYIYAFFHLKHLIAMNSQIILIHSINISFILR